MIWTYELVEQEFRRYRELRCEADELRIDLERLDEYPEDSREAVEAMVFQSAANPGMPHKTGVGKPTERIALSGDQVMEMRMDYRNTMRRLRRMDAWMAYLPNRERRVMQYFYLEGMTWAELSRAYNIGNHDEYRAERTLQDFKKQALNRICLLQKSKSARTGVEICVDVCEIS